MRKKTNYLLSDEQSTKGINIAVYAVKAGEGHRRVNAEM